MKKLLFIFSFFAVALVFGQTEGFQLSSHILDVSTGKPAQGVHLLLQKQMDDQSWKTVSIHKTDDNGRVKDMLPYGKADNAGIYKLIFETQTYYERMKVDFFYPFVEVVFIIKNQQHYHVPITLSPFGYSTYRGS